MSERGLFRAMNGNAYRGFSIWEGPVHPATGRWRARRQGVELCAGTREGLIRVIDGHIEDVRNMHEKPRG